MRLENIKDTSSTSQKEKDIAREGESKGRLRRILLLTLASFSFTIELCPQAFGAWDFSFFFSWRRCWCLLGLQAQHTNTGYQPLYHLTVFHLCYTNQRRKMLV